MKAKRLPFELVKNDDELAPHNLYHRRGILSAAQGVCWLVLAGVELQSQKKKAGHGNFEKWVEANCEFDIRTAQNYMGLAEKVKNRALKTKHVSFLKLLAKAPADLKPDEQRETIETVMSLTDGETLSELYRPILKLPAGAGLRGSQRQHHGSNGETDDAESATDIWKPHIDFLESDGVERRSWKDLPHPEQDRLRSVLADLNKLIPKQKQK